MVIKFPLALIGVSDKSPVSRVAKCTQKGRKRRKEYTAAHYGLVTNEGEIRLLKLFPSDHDNTQDDYEGMPTILCELVIIELHKDADTHILYEALSWCWGALDTNSYINIRKKGKIYVKYVRLDLVYAMHALRNHQIDRYLWIGKPANYPILRTQLITFSDAIFINQEDIKEKNHQIEMMAEIYGRAVQVCV